MHAKELFKNMFDNCLEHFGGSQRIKRKVFLTVDQERHVTHRVLDWSVI
jgi:hypothetical protein